MDEHTQDQLFTRVGQEIARKEFSPGAMARAVASAKGDKSIVEALYIECRVNEVAREQREAELNRRPTVVIRRVWAEGASYNCPHCNRRCLSGRAESGQEAQCPYCGRHYIVPEFT